MRTDSEILWAQRFRPKKIEDCILPSALKKSLKGIVDTGDLMNMVFAGRPGCGKTTAALAMCNEMGAEVLFLNGSGEDRGIETIRTKVTNFAYAMSMDGARKCVIFDEADNITKDAQLALRALIEAVSSNCSFILTCNYASRLEGALVESRLEPIEFVMPKNDSKEASSLQMAMFKRAKAILQSLEVPHEDASIAKIVANCYPDFRKTMNSLQRAASTGKVDDTAAILTSSSSFEGLKKAMASKEVGDINKWVAETHLTVGEIAQWLDNEGENIFADNNSWAQAIVTAAEYDYKSAFVAAPKVNMKAMIFKISSACKFKP